MTVVPSLRRGPSRSVPPPSPAHDNVFPRAVKPLVVARQCAAPRPPVPTDRSIALPVAYRHVALRERVKQAGAQWNSDRRVSKVHYDHAVPLGLGDHIVGELASTIGCLEVGATASHLDTSSTSNCG
jgi:hypothetical protein